MNDFVNENALWRRCEVAWAASLATRQYAVIKLADIGQNDPKTQTPLMVVNGLSRRAPDLQSVKNGKTEYWEVKFRTRADIDLNGAREYWISYASFRDYLAIAEGPGCSVYVVLYEGPHAGAPGQWFLTNIYKIRDSGREGTKFASGGENVVAWIWPRSIMERIEGPEINHVNATEPLLPNEGELPEILVDEFVPFERKLRRLRRPTPIDHNESRKSDGLSPALKVIQNDPLVALNTLRLSLGLAHQPKYSVLRVGIGDLNINEILGFLHYGIRVFLITNEKLETNLSSDELNAFIDSRMLEWAVLPKVALPPSWVIDGQIQDPAQIKICEAADLVGGINFKQFKIVHAPSTSDIVVTAGAGTGKTETMSERLVFLLATNASNTSDLSKNLVTDLRLDDIALVTFTKEAAKEMRSRIARTLALRQRLCSRCVLPALPWMMQLSSTNITTIHSFAQKLIQKGGASIGLSPNLSVSDRKMDFQKILHQILSADISALLQDDPRNIPASHLWQKHLKELWDSLSNNGIDLMRFSEGGQRTDVDWGLIAGSSISNRVSATVAKTTERLAIDFAEYCIDNQVIPVGQLVPTALEAMRNPSGLGTDGPRFLFVDEFQDTDAQQMDMILDVKRSFGSNLFVVGDVKQGIYRFRGAEGSAFKEFNMRFELRKLPPPIKLTLDRNFRSGAKLLKSINPYFAKWGSTQVGTNPKIHLLDYDPVKDALLPDLSRADKSTALSLAKVNWNQAVATAATQIGAWRTKSPTANIAIICRTNHQAKEIQRKIIANGGSCDLMVGGDFYRTPAVKELRVLLQALVDPSDAACLLELAETRWMAGIADPHSGRELPDPFRDQWGDDPIALISWRQRFNDLINSGNFDQSDLWIFLLRVKTLKSMLNVMPIMSLIVECDRVLSPAGSAMAVQHEGALSEQETIERQRYVKCLDHLLTILDLEFGDQPLTLVQLLSWLTLQIATNDREDEPFPAPKDSGRTLAITVHKAKGLEFDFVLIPQTGQRFNFPANRQTRVAVIREVGKKPAILWKWTPEGAATMTNVPVSSNHLWQIDDEESVREETRLLYVAMTRARTQLLIYMPANQKASGSAPNSWADLIGLV